MFSSDVSKITANAFKKALEKIHREDESNYVCIIQSEKEGYSTVSTIIDRKRIDFGTFHYASWINDKPSLPNSWEIKFVTTFMDNCARKYLATIDIVPELDSEGNPSGTYKRVFKADQKSLEHNPITR